MVVEFYFILKHSAAVHDVLLILNKANTSDEKSHRIRKTNFHVLIRRHIDQNFEIINFITGASTIEQKYSLLQLTICSNVLALASGISTVL